MTSYLLVLSYTSLLVTLLFDAVFAARETKFVLRNSGALYKVRLIQLTAAQVTLHAVAGRRGSGAVSGRAGQRVHGVSGQR